MQGEYHDREYTLRLSQTDQQTLLAGIFEGLCIPACIGTDTPPVDRMTDACENITSSQLRCRR